MQSYINEYNKRTYDLISVRIPKGTRDTIKSAAEKEGKSVNQYILDCIAEHENNPIPAAASPAQQIETAIRILNLCKAEIEENLK